MKLTCHENPLMPPTTTYINFTSLFLSFPAPSPLPPYSPLLPLLPSNSPPSLNNTSPQLPLPLDLIITVTSTGYFTVT